MNIDSIQSKYERTWSFVVEKQSVLRDYKKNKIDFRFTPLQISIRIANNHVDVSCITSYTAEQGCY